MFTAVEEESRAIASGVEPLVVITESFNLSFGVGKSAECRFSGVQPFCSHIRIKLQCGPQALTHFQRVRLSTVAYKTRSVCIKLTQMSVP